MTARTWPFIYATLLTDEMGNIGMYIFLVNVHDNLNFNNRITWIKGFRNIPALPSEMIPVIIKQPRHAFQLPPAVLSRDQLLCISTHKALSKPTVPDELKVVLLFAHPFTRLPVWACNSPAEPLHKVHIAYTPSLLRLLWGPIVSCG